MTQQDPAHPERTLWGQFVEFTRRSAKRVWLLGGISYDEKTLPQVHTSAMTFKIRKSGGNDCHKPITFGSYEGIRSLLHFDSDVFSEVVQKAVEKRIAADRRKKKRMKRKQKSKPKKSC